MSSNSGNLIQNLISGGMAAPVAKLIANAIANANTGQLSKGADSVDSTPSLAMRMIDADTRRYQFPNLDYSPDKPYQDTLGNSPVQYADATSTHPYQDAQPVKSAPPLSQPAIKGGAYVDAAPGVENNASQTTINLRIKQGDGTHLRLNPATNSIDSVPLTFNFPQGIVAGSVSETDAGTEITLSVPNQTLLGILAAYNRPVFQCRAYALFSARRNTSGTDDSATIPNTDRLIRSSGNVSHIQRTNSGSFKVFFITPMLTANYCVQVTAGSDSIVIAKSQGNAQAATYCYAYLVNTAQTGNDNLNDYVNVAVFE